MKGRELIRLAERGGAIFLRSRGDDRLYRMPDGHIVAIPLGGRQNEASVGAIASVRRSLRRAVKIGS